MIYSRLFAALAISSSFAGVALANPRGGQGGKGGNNQGSASSSAAASLSTATGAQGQGQGGGAQAVLNPANIQAGSASDGQGNAQGVKASQAASATCVPSSHQATDTYLFLPVTQPISSTSAPAKPLRMEPKSKEARVTGFVRTLPQPYITPH